MVNDALLLSWAVDKITVSFIARYLIRFPLSLPPISPSYFYLFAIAALSIALGIQIIVLPWLVVDYLSLNSVWVGWVQAAVLIPNLLLLLAGGVTADKGKGMQWLVPLLSINIVIHLVLAFIIQKLWLSLPILISYAALLGMSNAFVQPWREYWVKAIYDNTRISNTNSQDESLQQWIAKSSLCLYGGQAIGVLLASLSDNWGIAAVLVIQVCMIAIAALSFSQLLVRLPLKSATHRQSSPASLLAGFQTVWSLPALRSLIAIVAFNGFFHIGVFIVALPLLVQYVYGLTIDFYSGLQLTFVLGTIATTVLVICKGALDGPGRRVIFSLLYGGVILLALSAKPTIAGLFILLFSWGVVVGISSNMGRSVMQALAPEVSRGRIIAFYQLALFGSAPLGALFAGYAVQWWGVLTLLKISGIASLCIFATTLLTRSLWDVEVSSSPANE